MNIKSNGYRLPTEAEWEFAAWGGKKRKGYKYSGSDNLSTIAWYCDNSGDQTHDVAKKAPNELGLYDMSGNVWEWCWDWCDSYSSAAQTNPVGASSGDFRVVRGGGWEDISGSCRVACRYYGYPYGWYSNIGFRLVRSAN
jgi:formylglycine-generating enzyme required for sulfatase activity